MTPSRPIPDQQHVMGPPPHHGAQQQQPSGNPAASAAVASASSSSVLERRMELLEARFVLPPAAISVPVASQSATSTPTFMASPPPAGRRSTGANTPGGVDGHSSTSKGTPVRSNRQQHQQSATTIGFGPSGIAAVTSPLGAGGGSTTSNHSASHHSFSFDKPSESSRDAILAASQLPAGAGGAGTSDVMVQNHSASVREVSLAAERHMAKVGHRLNIPLPSSGGMQQQHDCSSSSVPASVVGGDSTGVADNSCSSSNQTIVTGHHAAIELVQQPQPQPAPSGGKRKSITPSKREPSVKDPTRGSKNTTTNTAAAHGKKNQRKQGVKPFGSNASTSAALRPSNGQTGGGGGSRKRSATSAALSSGHHHQSTTTSTSSRDGSASAGGGGAGSIQSFLGSGGGGGAGGGGSNNSNSKSNPSSSLSSWRTAKVAPPNNTRIHDFFGSVKKRASGSSTSAAKKKAKAGMSSSSAAGDHGKTMSAEEAKDEQQQTNNVGIAAASAEGTFVSTAAAAAAPKPSEAMTRELGQYRKRCVELEGALADRDEKLRAVSNNQTMIHASLRATLDRRENEIDKLRAEMEQRSTAVSATIEMLVRSDAAREAVELRQKLASDGARLGRIVYTRAGMHSVESWEDGHASRSLKKRRAELREKRFELEQRQRAAASVAKEFRAAAAGGNQAAPGDSNFEPVGGIVIQDEFDVMEAEESIRLHLANLKKQEDELEEEERALVTEKEAHIRALKRVASEDSSRFKHRPKLHERYVPLCQLGKGGFSEVWRAYDLIEMKEVAVKIHQLDPRWSDAKKENYTKHVSREYEIHRGVRHPRIVSLFDVFEIDTNSFATVLECCEGTDLDRILKDKKLLPERDARAILLQILSGMRYLSSPSPDGSRQGIIHYDLKPGNILFDKHGDAKITDFGLSKIVDAADSGDSMELTSQGAGTYWYLPPECFLTHHGVRISNKVDVWSIGVIFYQMLFGKRPFGHGQSQDHVLNNNIMLNARDVRFPTMPQVSAGAKDFIRQCLTYDQTFRPNINQLCANPYLQQETL